MKSQMTTVLASFAVLVLMVISWPQFVAAQDRVKPIPHPFDIPQHAPARAPARTQSRAAVNHASSASSAALHGRR